MTNPSSSSSDKPWLDIGTMCIPRLCLDASIRSFFEHWQDRDRFRVRWIFHLDQYGLPGLEQYWREQVEQAVELTELFDDVVLMATTRNRGYGDSFHRVLSVVVHPFFYSDDDNIWRRPIELSFAYDSTYDHFSFNNAAPGGTSPAYWSFPMVRHLLYHYPANHRKITELALRATLKGAAFKSNHDPEKKTTRQEWPYKNWGARAMSVKGVQWFGMYSRYFENGKVVNVPKDLDAALKIANNDG